jgi:predicted nucleotidyltransferase
MKIHHALDEVLANRARTKVVRALIMGRGEKATGRGLARQARISHVQAAEALRELEAIGLTSRQVVGSSTLWSIERKNVLVRGLTSLFQAEARLEEALISDLKKELKGLPLQRVSLFGSVARREETAESDLDVFVVVNDERDAARVQDKLFAVKMRVRRRYGVWLSPIVYSARALKRPPKPELLAEIDRDSLPVLGG